MAAESLDSNFVSIKPAVEFLDIQDQYSYNNDLRVKFKFNDYTPQEGDRIAIFKLGWTFVKDYVVFEWAPIGQRNNQHSVTFNKHILPKNNHEIYQICYVSGENVLHGASSPLQFSSEEPIMSQSGLSVVASTTTVDTINDRSNSSFAYKDELKKLKEENEMLRESLKAVIAQKVMGGCNKDYDKDINDLRTVTDGLKAELSSLQKEMEQLKSKIRQGGEEYKKLYLEKLKIEKKYDKLKNKSDEHKKSDAEMVNFDLGDLKSIPPFPFTKRLN